MRVICRTISVIQRILYHARLIYVKYTNKSGCNHNRVDKTERLNKRQLSKSNIMVSINITMSYIQTRHRVKSIDYNQYLILSIFMSRDQKITTTKGIHASVVLHNEQQASADISSVLIGLERCKLHVRCNICASYSNCLMMWSDLKTSIWVQLTKS